MNTLKALTAALVLTLGASFAAAASAGTDSNGVSLKATPVQYDRRYDDDRRDRYRDDDRGRHYDRGRYDDDRHGRDGYGYRDQRRPRGGYGGGYYPWRARAWDWDGDGVPNRYDARPRNPWRS